VLVPDDSSLGSDAWLTRARTLYGYDDETFEHPPHEHGDLTRETSFSDIVRDVASETFHRYDASGNLIWRMNPVGIVQTTEYDPARHLFPVSSCTPVGCATTKWDEVLGVAEFQTDANQQTTRIDHDAFGRATTTTRPDGSTNTIRYLATGTVTGPDSGRQRTRTELSDGSPGDGVHWLEDLTDGLGRVYRSLDEGLSAAQTDVIVSDTRFVDASARPAAVSMPHTAAERPRWTTYSYDGAHRLTDAMHPGTATVKTSRTYRLGAVEERDELGHFTTTYHDPFGRTVRVDEHVRPCTGCEAETLTTQYTYDAFDRLTSITDAAGHTTTFIRDDLGRETSITDPDLGTRARAWRADGTLDVETDANGTHAWTYDGKGRPSTRTHTGVSGVEKAHWDYDHDPATGQAQGWSIGLPTLIMYESSAGNASVSGTERFWYDEVGRPIRAQHCVDAVCLSMGYTYDSAGRIRDLHYPKPGDPDGEHVTYNYDPAGRLTAVGAYLTNIQHDAAGHTISQMYGNGLVEQFTYDPDRQWLDSHALVGGPKGNQGIYAATYTHDLAAHITDLRTSNAQRSLNSSVTETFAYDDLGRLVTHTSSDRPSLIPERYEYDALGRMTRAPKAGVYHYDDPAHLHAVTSSSAGHQRTYDAAGNLKNLSDPSGRSLNISWTPSGMPQTIANGHGQTAMAYGADGGRVKQSRGGATTYYFDRYLEQDNTGLTRYYWAGDQLIARRDPNGAVFYPAQDHLHSTRVVTDDAGAVTARYNYEPYGAEKPSNQVDDTKNRWQGQRPDADSGLVYMNARYYDPELGLFTAADSIIPNSYRPQSLNRYSFNEGDPVNRYDPSGHMSMRVELKKEQEARSRILVEQCNNVFVTCVTGASDPNTRLATYTWYQPCLPCSDPSEWAPWPEDSLSAPPLLAADSGSAVEVAVSESRVAAETTTGDVTVVEEGQAVRRGTAVHNSMYRADGPHVSCSKCTLLRNAAESQSTERHAIMAGFFDELSPSAPLGPFTPSPWDSIFGGIGAIAAGSQSVTTLGTLAGPTTITFASSSAVGSLTGVAAVPAGYLSAGEVLAGSYGVGVAASAAAGVAGSFTAGYGIGTFLDWAYKQARHGQPLGADIYDWCCGEQRSQPTYIEPSPRPGMRW
jgi:RHS repeat-associated protein